MYELYIYLSSTYFKLLVVILSEEDRRFVQTNEVTDHGKQISSLSMINKRPTQKQAILT